jgi:hypothetical protein
MNTAQDYLNIEWESIVPITIFPCDMTSKAFSRPDANKE